MSGMQRAGIGLGPAVLSLPYATVQTFQADANASYDGQQTGGLKKCTASAF